ncbi:MAG: SurA N-terminal domain-containing protein [Pseudomonadota bacterium]
MLRQASFKRHFFASSSLLALLFLFVTVTTSTALTEKLVDRVVAVVNEEVITLSELDLEAAPTLEKIKTEVPPAQLDEAISRARKEILRSMIDEKLLLQRAAERHMEVGDQEIDAAIDRILQENNVTVDEFRTQLLKMGITEKHYRSNLRKQILRSKLLAYEIRSKVVITNEQVEAYYRTINTENTGADVGYHILQFGSTWGETGRSATRDEASKKASQLRDMILAGENFNDIAKNYSDLPSARDGGDIGFLEKTEMADYMWQAISKLRPGDVSEVIETPAGFQFFKLLSSNKDGVITQAPLADIREEIRTALYDQELKKKFDSWVKELRENSYVEELL